MDLNNSKILLTGATGLIGGEIYRRLPDKDNVYLLCRNIKTARERLLHRQKIIIDNKVNNEFNIVEGDLTKTNWGLKEFDYDIIIHCAGDTSFIRSCKKTNVNGIKNLIDLIKSVNKKPFLVYFGTASNHGIIRDKYINEEYKGVNEPFNPYTKTKRISEELVKNNLTDYVILKPTITLADNVNDKKLASYISWIFCVSKYFDYLPFRPDSFMDYIPVSFLGDVVLKLLQKDKLKYREYFLCCGKEKSIRLDEKIKYLDKYFNRTPLKIGENIKIDYNGEQKRLFNGIKYYLPYANMNVTYDNSRLKEELGNDVESPYLLEYIDLILKQIDKEDVLKEIIDP